jgi:RHS repeat-associated protein
MEGGERRVSEVSTLWTSEVLDPGTLGERSRVLLDSQTARTYEPALAGNPIVTTVVSDSSAYDDFGNVEEQIVSVYPGGPSGTPHRTVTTTQYLNDPDPVDWRIGLPERQTTEASTPDGTTVTRVVRNEYDPVTAAIAKSIVEPDRPELRVETTYGYDSFGNVKSITESGQGVTSRSDTIEYDSRGQFPIFVRNALGHETDLTFDSRTGLVATLVDPNGLGTSWTYDGLGRQTRVVKPDGTERKIHYRHCLVAQSCSATAGRAPLVVTEQTSDGPSVATFLDVLARPVLIQREGFGTTSFFQTFEYDGRGRLFRESRPYPSGAAANTRRYTSYLYDRIGRPSRVTTPDDGVRDFRYEPRIVRQETRAVTGQGPLLVGSIERNAMGWVIRSVNPANMTVNFEHDPFGNVKSIVAPGNARTEIEYDDLGRPTELSDPDRGLRSTHYNVLGEVAWQQDGKGQVRTYKYDTLGRITERVDGEGTHRWFYDTGRFGVGSLAEVRGPSVFRSFSYDAKGRLAAQLLHLGQDDFVVGVGFDEYGREFVRSYPGGYAVEQKYQGGYLERVVEASSGTVLWRATDYDGDDLVRQSILGNGVTTTVGRDATGRLASVLASTTSATLQNLAYAFDTLGSLRTREDLLPSPDQVETLAYDEAQRLKSVTGSPFGTKNYDYDAVGNLSGKPEVGSLYYEAAQPHAVSSTLGVAGTRHYGYDANGNMTCARATVESVDCTGGIVLQYGSFDVPTRIAGSSGQSNLLYDSDFERVRQSSTDSAGVTRTTVYVGGIYERVTSVSEVEHVSYVFAGNDRVAVHRQRSSGFSDTRYLHRDHLGSVVAVTNVSGSVTERQTYDAFGSPRNASGATLPPTQSQLTVSRTFTDHELLKSVGMIHMNGRVYDPLLGRMTQADPVTPEPLDPAGQDPFSYVRNDPGSLTDPTGFDYICLDYMECFWFRAEQWLNSSAQYQAYIKDAYPFIYALMYPSPQNPAPEPPPPPPPPTTAQTKAQRKAEENERCPIPKNAESVQNLALELSRQARAGAITDVEAAARVVGFAASQSSDPTTVMTSVGQVLGGASFVPRTSSPLGVQRIQPGVSSPSVQTSRGFPGTGFGQTGFLPQFQENLPTGGSNNQVVHLVGFMAIGFRNSGALGRAVGVAALFGNEAAVSGPEFDLGMAGLDIGSRLGQGGVAPGDLPNIIRLEIGGVSCDE